MESENEDRLSRQELVDRFDLLVADAREYAVILFDLEGKVLCWNPGAERIFGYQATEVVGGHFSRFYLPEDIRNGQPEHEIKAAREQGHSESVRWQLRRDGTRLWCQATLTPLFDEDKQVRSFVRVVHDLTEGDAHEAQRKRSSDLSDANRSMEEFLALLSHELRNPLGPILNAISVQRQIKTADPILQQAGDIIQRQVTLMVRLVDDLLDISRITKGKLRIEKEQVELRVVVNRAADSARLFINTQKHDFSLLLPTEPLWIEADPLRLEQIVINLLNNAAKYTDPGGLIRLTVSQEGDEALVSVKDSGLGISPEMLPKIFTLFAQVDETLNRSHGGLGIGLALVSTLVELHNGRITVHSAGLGLGSEFTVRLPMLPREARALTATPSLAATSLGRSLRVLVVEDNIDSGDCLSLLLRMHGHEVAIARTGPVALEMASTFRPHVVLMDIGLPGMDGYQVARQLRGRPDLKDVILCALTGFTLSEADSNRPQESGFDYHFVKPLPLETLLEVLARAKA